MSPSLLKALAAKGLVCSLDVSMTPIRNASGPTFFYSCKHYVMENGHSLLVSPYVGHKTLNQHSQFNIICDSRHSWFNIICKSGGAYCSMIRQSEPGVWDAWAIGALPWSRVFVIVGIVNRSDTLTLSGIGDWPHPELVDLLVLFLWPWDERVLLGTWVFSQSKILPNSCGFGVPCSNSSSSHAFGILICSPSSPLAL